MSSHHCRGAGAVLARQLISVGEVAVGSKIVSQTVKAGSVKSLDKRAPTAVDDLGACVDQGLIGCTPVHVIVERTVGLGIGTAGLGDLHLRSKGDAVLVLTIAYAGGNPEHAGPVRVITCSRLITVHGERLARSERVRRGRATIPEAGRAEDTRRSHRLDQLGLKGFVCSPVARIHHAQRDALPAVPLSEGGGRVYRVELPRGIDRCTRSRRIVAGVITIFRRFPAGFCRIEFRRTRGDIAGVSRVLVRARRLIRAGRRPGKDRRGQANTKYQENSHTWSLLPLRHNAILPTWLMHCFHF